MPLVVESPSPHLARLAEENHCTARMWSYKVGVYLYERLSYPLLWIWCEVAPANLWIDTASPIYAPFIPPVTFTSDLSYRRSRIRRSRILEYIMVIRGADSSLGWLVLYNAIGYSRSELITTIALTDRGYLDIKDFKAGEHEYNEFASSGLMVLLRLLSQFML